MWWPEAMCQSVSFFQLILLELRFLPAMLSESGDPGILNFLLLGSVILCYTDNDDNKNFRLRQLIQA